MNQIVLGTIHEGKLCSIHRLDKETEQGWPVKYWPGGPDGSSESGWYYYDSNGAIEGTFSHHPFGNEPFDYPLITAYDTEYGAVVLAVIVPAYRVKKPEFTVQLRPVKGEELKGFLANFNK